MTLITLPKLSQTGTNEWADVEDNDKAIRDVVNGNLDNTNLSGSAAIDPSKINFSSGGGIVSSGKAVIAGAETTTSTSYTTMTTPDQVTGIVLPTDGLIWVSYRALVADGLGGGYAAIFLGSNQLKKPMLDAAPAVAETAVTDNNYQWIYTDSAPGILATPPGLIYMGIGSGTASGGVTTGMTVGSAIGIEAAANTYTVSVRFKASSSSTFYASDRKLRVWSQSFG